MEQMSPAMSSASLEAISMAQRQWAAEQLPQRLEVIARFRRRMASETQNFAALIPTRLPGSLHRSVADSLVSEVLPLIEACRFLEREAAGILRTRHMGSDGRPVWLSKVESEVERTPWGIVLVLAAGNYPLLLAGVQTLQALVAGNAVLWKPAPGTESVAIAVRALLVESGLNSELLTVLNSEVASATEAIAAGVDHVVLTGSAETGKAVLRELAETLTPATMELSGCDAVYVLPGADPEHLVRALGFGLRFNGSFTCMAPRRLFLVGLTESDATSLETRLADVLGELAAVALSTQTLSQLAAMIADAYEQGAAVVLDGLDANPGDTTAVRTTLITRATPALMSMQTEIFAPILSVMRVADAGEAVAASAACRYALTASIFGPEKQARALASRVRVGNVLINDVVVPTADPRISFGGRGSSGFGVTRGAEGLLAMTTPRTIQVQRGRSSRAYEQTGSEHVDLFAGLAQMLHGQGLGNRLAGLRQMVRAARSLK